MSILAPSMPRVKAGRSFKVVRPFAEGLVEAPPAAAPTESKTVLDSVPATVNKVRLLSGAAAGVYLGVEGPTGFREWHRDGDGVVMIGLEMDKAYAAGRVAILSDGPLGTFPAPKPSSRRALDDSWNSGWCLGRLGLDAAPCVDWPADVRASFNDGYAWGVEQLEAARQADHLEELARENAWIDEQAALEAERAEAGWGCYASEGR